jgi:UDP-N-acetylmuramate--alanine ligase
MYRKIYFMGIKGVGMATLAVVAKQARLITAGSDVEEEFITDKILKEAGTDIRLGFKKENPRDFFGTTPKDECLFIATAAHDGFDNIEAKWAKDHGVKVISHGEAVGVFMEGDIFGRKFEGISISGAHGKTTIAGMISAYLTILGLDPSFTVGTSEIFPIGAAGHFGTGKYFVAEADEYFSETKFDPIPKFLYQKPKYLIINNIDFDHPDIYPNLDSVIAAYKNFILNVPAGGLLIVNGDDSNIKGIIKDDKRIKIITYGSGSENEFVINNFRGAGFSSEFEVLRNDTLLGTFKLSVPGYHNAKNSLAVIALLIELGVGVADIQKAMPEFKGVKRRLEKIGETETGALIFDDYAHHPAEIRKTLEALHLACPSKDIILVFQAHTYGRTKALLQEFVSSFAGAREVIILKTFASARDSKDHGPEDDQEFVEKIRTVQANVKLMETKERVVEYIKRSLWGSDKIIVTMGAGDVYKISEKLKGKS